MKTEEEGSGAIEPELIEPETALVRPAMPATIDALAEQEDGVVRTERAVQILTSLRKASIAQTHPHDYTLYRSPEGQITAYLESLACWNLRPLWGVDTLNVKEIYRVEHEDGTYAWCIEAEGYCKRTDTPISAVTGICMSNEEFLVKRKLHALKLDLEMKKTARQRMEGMLVREAAGLKRVPIQELDEVWKGTWKNSSMCPKGRGFGSGAERAGGAAEQHGIDAADIPECDVCRIPLVFRAGKDGKEGFFGCRNWDKHKDTKVIVPLSAARGAAERKHAQRREPGDE